MALEAGGGGRSWRWEMNDAANFGGRTPDGACEADNKQLGGYRPGSACGHRDIQVRQLMRVVGRVFPVVGIMVVRCMIAGGISLVGMPFLHCGVLDHHVEPDAEIEAGHQDPSEKSHFPDDTPDVLHEFSMVGSNPGVN